MTTDALDWTEEGTPVSRRFDDPYFSLASGLEETRHVFFGGNDLPARLRAGFRIAELGFGTGLNLLALNALRGDLPLRFTSFEAFPLTREDAGRALAAFPDLDAAPLLAAWDRLGQGAVEVWPGLEVDLILGDARQTLPAWDGLADAWFLDGFSPAKNPELWGAELLEAVAAHTAPGGTLATYTAAGHVRRALEAAGLAVERRSGYGRKRHMTAARKPD
ncbi:tRNA (5-methylaminomethyl-2-thiouridine)(34)-methyltransferase MnmD [Pseudoroseicyclus aestuarii]|uniref:tRNA U34 5-methylaminomethyl-2-thiouridine-forming methyltransferase MnmC n=1 Tax=Pseudoroseicyclus aestuarii TaxID=1795041 RepID=A0A318SWX4_9RHOB|nr:tRNA (5-methylaminomethyl-2-thiouridine)(34)-methyltransferase MnmD [Pseudoroseicyclus aestuarii]PYE84899.1 tRNA U34 5-methylaminomethyl-2-thiouridine-forming methyltransferase MnmC [Pseudoroseicyclus aestuarii]